MRDERLKLVSYCPLCGPRAGRVEARVLGGVRDVQLLHVTCRKCAAQMLALTLVGPGNAGAVGLVTDLSADDVLRLANASAISSDEVLNFHRFLANTAAADWMKLTDPSLHAVRTMPRRPAAARKAKPVRARSSKPRRAGA